MRVSTLLPAALAAAPLAVSAAGSSGRLGFALGARMPDQSCKTQADYEADFDALKPHTTIVRTYSAIDGAVPTNPCNVTGAILPAAAAKGFQVILGVWPDTEESFEKDLSTMSVVKSYQSTVYAITVGSETLYRGNFTGPELLDRISRTHQALAKAHVTGMKVGTADSWNKFQDGTADALIQNSKGLVQILLVNAFAYWQGQPISNATATYLDDLMQAITVIQDGSGSTNAIEIWNGETGWPGDGGSDYGAAKAGTANEKTFFKQGVCAALDWGFNVFYFEAFDETWKPKSVGDSGSSADERHWGAFTDQRQPKFAIGC